MLYPIGPHIDRDYASGARPSMLQHLMAADEFLADDCGFRAGAVALFVSSPRQKRITLAEAERAELAGHIGATGLRVVAHSTYVASPWASAEAAAFVAEEARVCRDAGIGGLVVHLPKAPPATVLARLPDLAVENGPRIYLETPAVTSEKHYETPEKLAALFREVRKLDPDGSQFGLCVDSAHLWVSGVDLRSADAAGDWLAGLERHAGVIPPATVMFHINDSARPRGSGPDAHAGLQHGEIWKDLPYELSGLSSFVDYIRRNRSITILERKPKADLVGDLQIMRRQFPENLV